MELNSEKLMLEANLNDNVSNNEHLLKQSELQAQQLESYKR